MRLFTARLVEVSPSMPIHHVKKLLGHANIKTTDT
jgi:hypothetical protein